MTLKSRWLQWQAKRSDRRRANSLRNASSVALGFAWRARNIGGVRRHLECIENYSRHNIALYPSVKVDGLLKGSDRNDYHASLSDALVDRHDLIHTHVDPKFIKLAQTAQQQQGKPWLHTYHLLYFPEDWNGQLAPWQVEINDCLLHEARHADVRLSVGSWLVDWLQENHGIESSFVPNGVDVASCDRAEGDRFLDRFGIKDFVLFVNSISGVKNPLAFVEAARRFPDVPFVMIGTGLTPQNLARVFEVELPRNLIAIGPLPHHETLDAIAACRVFLMTSHREGLPTVLLEAMAMNKSCVAPDKPWVRDAIQTANHGLTFDLDDPVDMDRQVKNAMSSTFDKARAHVDSLFTWPIIMNKIDSLYDDLLAG